MKIYLLILPTILFIWTTAHADETLNSFKKFNGKYEVISCKEQDASFREVPASESFTALVISGDDTNARLSYYKPEFAGSDDFHAHKYNQGSTLYFAGFGESKDGAGFSESVSAARYATTDITGFYKNDTGFTYSFSHTSRIHEENHYLTCELRSAP